MRRIRFRRRPERHNGAALVEFAVVLPLLMMILFGIIEFGHLFKIRQTCQHAAREGSRLAVLQSTQKPYSSGPVVTRITEIMTAANIPFTTDMLTIDEDSLSDPNVTITITIPYEDIALTHYLGAITSEVSGTCSMRKEGV